MNTVTWFCRWRGSFGLLSFVLIVAISQATNAQLAGQFYSAPGSMAAYEYQRDGIETVMLPADIGVTFSGSGPSSTLTAIIRKPIIGDTREEYDYPIVNEFPMEVTGTSSDGEHFHGDLLGTQYLFDWDFESAAAGELLWSGSVYWAGGRIELTTISDVRLIPAPPGDFNVDGAVDVADYVLWRKTNGTPTGFDAWREHFGARAGTGSGAALGSADQGGVPEPATVVMLMIGAALRASRARRAAQQR